MSLDDDCLLISLVFFFSLSLFHDANDTRPLLRTGRTNGRTDGWMAVSRARCSIAAVRK